MNKPICKECTEKNMPYSVHQPSSGMTTLADYPSGYWDEQGKYIVNPDRNTTTYTYTCSNGHTWSESN